MVPQRAAARNPPTSAPAAGPKPERSPQQDDADSRWLQTLSEPELDLLISLKELAATRAINAGHPSLANKFHLRTLRGLGIVLLEILKERVKEISTSVDTSMLDRLALLRDPDVSVPTHRNGVDKKRKQVQHGSDEEGALSPKRRKVVETREE